LAVIWRVIDADASVNAVLLTGVTRWDVVAFDEIAGSHFNNVSDSLA
jgi:predicted ATP-dependent Lon-type protease